MPPSLDIAPITALPDGFATLRAEAAAERLDNIETLWSQWQDGSNRFRRPGELLLAARVGGDLAGLGGITEDFIDPRGLRMRRFYVRPAYRRSGVGRAIVRHLLAHARPLGRPIWLYTESPAATLFWQAMGFVPVDPGQDHARVARDLLVTPRTPPSPLDIS